MGQKGCKMVKNTYVDDFGPFWTLLDYFGALTSLPCLAIFGPKWTIFLPSLPSHERWTPIQEKAHHQVSYVWPS